MTMNQPSAVAIAGALAVVLGLAAPAHAVFTGGPSVRVTPNDQVEIRWIVGFAGDGTVDLFDNPDGTGTAIIGQVSVAPATDHTITFNVGGAVVPDTHYYFKVLHRDPNKNLPDTTNEPPPFPPVFTGVQAISGLSVVTGNDSALVSWDANVIGWGRVQYNLAPDPTSTGPPPVLTVGDTLNVTDHMIELTGLSPRTTYHYLVSNLHAIDGGTLAEEFGSFTTVPEPSAVILASLAMFGVVSRRPRRNR